MGNSTMEKGENKISLNSIQATEETEIDLRELLGLYLSRLRLIIVTMIIGGLVMGVVTYFLITPKYTASTKIYMVSASSGSAIDLTDLNIGTSLSSDYAVLMDIRPIYEDVIEELGLSYTYTQLQNMVDISAISNTRVIQLSVVSTDPREACDIANCMAQKALTYLPELMETSTPHIAETAIVPTKQSSPNMVKNVLIGAMLGALLSLAYLTLIYVTDDSITSSEEMEKLFGIVPLTVIPEGDIKEISDERELEIIEMKKKERGKKKGHHSRRRRGK